MEKFFLFVANPEDHVLLEELPEQTFWEDCQQFIALPQLIQDLRFLPNAELISWGNYFKVQDSVLEEDQDLIESSTYLNNKVNQATWRIDTDCSPIHPKIIQSLDALQDALEDLEFPIVIKSKFGLAGRNHIILESQKEHWKLQEIERKLNGFPLVLESWKKDRVLDFSTLWQGEAGGLRFLGTTEMLIDEKGGFRGIYIAKDLNPILSSFLPKVYDQMMKVQKELLFPAIGPLAMDGFLFREKGELDLKLQPFSEINFRWSIGRILWEIRKKRRVESKGSGILFLSFGKSKDLDPFLLLKKIRTEWRGTLFFVSPPKDIQGKLFQQAGIYFESDEDQGPLDLISICNSFA